MLQIKHTRLQRNISSFNPQFGSGFFLQGSDAAVKPMHSCQGLGFNAATHATVHTTHTCITTMQLAKILSQNSMLAPTQSCPMF
jgi:hypothetical protein